VSGAATAVGPILGGLLTEGFGWRWIFLVNLPVCVLALVLCKIALPADGERRGGRLDLWGTVTFTVAAGALTFALIRADDDGWHSPRIWGLLALSAVALAAFALVEKRTPYAMFDLGLLRNRSFAGILVAGLLINFAAFAAFTYTSIWLQSVIGLSPLRAGLTGLPVSICSMLASGIAGARLHGRSPRLTVGGGLLLIGLGSLISGFLVDATASWPALIPGYAVVGLGVGLAMPALASSAMAEVPARRAGMAAGSLSTVRQLGYAVGVAVLGTVFAARAEHHLTGQAVPDPAATAKALAGGQAAGILAAVPEPARAAVSRLLHVAAAAGLDAGFLVSGGIGLAGALAVAVLVRPAPRPTADGERVPEPAAR
jgi:predicted MFS family arabinose efflux permease